jgi:predicted GNAT superfamily acetyltransferase
MQSVVLRDAAPADFDVICALNLAEVEHTSPMDVDRLGELHSLAAYHQVACVDGRVMGFLLAMPHDAAYRNDNFEWFLRRFDRFLYVDRIVVSGRARGLRLGSLLYDDLFDFARAALIPLVTCEYNISPPNEPSRRFHDKYGFKEFGTHWVAGGTKQVSLQAAETGARFQAAP